MGITGVEGTFKSASEETLRVLREEEYIILTILDVFRFDPLYRWSSPELSNRALGESSKEDMDLNSHISNDTGNKDAARALLG